MTKKITGEVVPDDDFKSLIGEGFHTAFRKGVDSPYAHTMWKAIQDCPAEDWDCALDYVVWGIGYSGYKLVQVES